jgi:phage tail sheath gpL-like
LCSGRFALNQKSFRFVVNYQHNTHTMASTAVNFDLLSRVLGYKILKGIFQKAGKNLPMRIAIIGEANEANQNDLDTDPVEVPSAKKAGELFGYGSPIHMIMRILKPVSSDGVGTIPIIVFPQAKAVGATQKTLELEVTGVATANGTHTLKIAGRTGIDGASYDVNIEEGDNAATILGKIADAVNNVLGAPVIATEDDYTLTLTSKWAGLTADGLNVEVLTNGNDLGLTYAIADGAAGSGTPSVAASLDAFGNKWNTIVVNSYGLVSSVLNALENFNGIADPTTPTGRYGATTFKPFVAITGDVSDDPSATTDARKLQMTIAVAAAPGSPGLHFEAAANYTHRQAIQAQNAPSGGIGGQFLPDMPVPTEIGSMANYFTRNDIMKKGCSTVDLVSDLYQIQDFVTTYHPDGEIPPSYRYVRDIILDWNFAYRMMQLQQLYVIDHVICNDDDTVTAPKVVKPKTWKQNLFSLVDECVSDALIVDPSFTKDSIVVNIGTTNPNRLETFLRYKRTGLANVVSTDVEAGFNFGNV